MSNTPAGWYPQPDGQQRYWDGQTWTEHFAPGAGQQPQATAPASAAVAAGAVSTTRPWFRKKRVLIPAGLAGFVILGSALTAGGDQTPSQESALKSATTSSAQPTPATKASPAAETVAPSATATVKPAPAKPKATAGQANALRSAENYIDLKGFSKKGLIQQLSSEYGDGFKKADATWAVEHLDVNWNEQAVRAAQSYLELKGFSRNGLIEQLSSEYGDQFTVKQATYAAQKVGL
ncbi:Ltp family lipoprotein [Phycicoccus sonneratiae]|uniref:Ltp family lipoprotein n=1 Tax=Phycicoccus sonneratiae TaxID=2807628 RepID=A0ABS2CK60_9MICO|nr:Ltp family lipoprotein [Phycicoccus sonneraticus]MBM6400266.1 Ltp family lipoprotein [Phycicoccus sonneraticus]